MRRKPLVLLAIPALAGFSPQAKAAITLGTAGNFAVLAGSTVTNTATPTVIDGGDVGVSPGSAITSFPPGIIVPPFTMHAADGVAGQAQSDLTIAYGAAAALVPTQTLTGDLGGRTLTPGVYRYSSSALLTGMLTLNDLGDPNAQFVFEIGSTLTTAPGSSVVTINGGPMPGCTVFWQVGSSATLDTNTAFEGHILALTSITLNSGATVLDGSALARNGAVTLDNNRITNCYVGSTASLSPEPAAITLALLGGALLGLPALGKRFRASLAAKSWLQRGVAA